MCKARHEGGLFVDPCRVELFRARRSASLTVALSIALATLSILSAVAALAFMMRRTADQLSGVRILRRIALFGRDLEAGSGASLVVASGEAALGAGGLVFAGSEGLRRWMMTLLLSLTLTFGLESFAVVLSRGGGGVGAGATSLISAALGGGCDGKQRDDQ